MELKKFGPWRIERQIGYGGQSRVYEALHQNNEGMIHALKLVKGSND